MKRFSEQFKKKANTISLTVAEKDVLRERIVSYMEYHPLPVAATAPKKSVQSPFLFKREPFIEFMIPSRYMRALAIGCLLFVVVGTPLLAENAIPGDVLYSMKVRVNEEVRGSLATTPYEKVAWETQRLERRISEARVLAKEGRLTPEAEAGVIAAVTEHQANTEAEIETLRTTDKEAATLAQMTLASVLDVQSAALRAQDEGSTTRGMSTVALALVLDEAQDKVEQKTDTDVSYERMMAQLETETTRGRELLASIKNSATEQEYVDLERRLGDVERKVSTAEAEHGIDPSLAMNDLMDTWRDMQVIITFMTDIDVRASLAIETMVPVVLTPEEERSLAILAYEEASKQLADIEAKLPNVTEDGVVEKVSLMIPKVTELLATATTTLDTDAVKAKELAEEARDYTRSVIALAAFNDQPGVEVTATTATIPATTTTTSTATTTQTSATSTASTTDTETEDSE